MAMVELTTSFSVVSHVIDRDICIHARLGHMDGIEQHVVDVNIVPSSLVVPVIAGGIAGLFTDITLFPLDTVKTRLQQGAYHPNMFRSLYQGLGPAAIASAPSAAIFFGTYEYMKRSIPGPGSSVFANGSAAAVAEVAACVFKVPFEVVKQRLQVSSTHTRGTPRMLGQIYRTEGLRGCYSGLGATMAREIPFGFIQMPVYEILKSRIIGKGENSDLSSVQACACGAVAGGVAAAATCPIDVWKTRLMLGNKNVTIMSILEKEGMKSLFAGLTPRVIWISLGGSIFFGAYEFVSRQVSPHV